MLKAFMDTYLKLRKRELTSNSLTEAASNSRLEATGNPLAVDASHPLPGVEGSKLLTKVNADPNVATNNGDPLVKTRVRQGKHHLEVRHQFSSRYTSEKLAMWLYQVVTLSQ